MKNGQKVEIVKTNHNADVKAGMRGVIDGATDGGFGVKVEGMFMETGANPMFRSGVRTVWVERDKLKEV